MTFNKRLWSRTIFATVLVALGIYLDRYIIGNRPSHGGLATKLVQIQIQKVPNANEWVNDYNIYICPLDVVQAKSSWGLVVFVRRTPFLPSSSPLTHQIEMDLLGLDESTIIPIILKPDDMSKTSDQPIIVPIDLMGSIDWSAVNISHMSLRINNYKGAN